MRAPDTPVALTIAGSDSGGEAGLQADLKTFTSLKVHGVCAITCVTAQNRRSVSRLDPCSPGMVRAQLEAVAAQSPPSAAKTGMLFSAAIVREVARLPQAQPRPPAGRGSGHAFHQRPATICKRHGLAALQRELFPLAALVTPNLMEAEVLAGQKITSPQDLRTAAATIHRKFGCAALVKGGHLAGTTEAVDFLCSDDGEWMFSAPRARGVTLHGTGCVYSAAITAWLARGRSLQAAVRLAKDHITQAIFEARSSSGKRNGFHH